MKLKLRNQQRKSIKQIWFYENKISKPLTRLHKEKKVGEQGGGEDTNN